MKIQIQKNHEKKTMADPDTIHVASWQRGYRLAMLLRHWLVGAFIAVAFVSSAEVRKTDTPVQTYTDTVTNGSANSGGQNVDIIWFAVVVLGLVLLVGFVALGWWLYYRNRRDAENIIEVLSVIENRQNAQGQTSQSSNTQTRVSRVNSAPFKFNCPLCGKRLSVDQELINQMVPCGHCKQTITVPDPHTILLGAIGTAAQELAVLNTEIVKSISESKKGSLREELEAIMQEKDKITQKNSELEAIVQARQNTIAKLQSEITKKDGDYTKTKEDLDKTAKDLEMMQRLILPEALQQVRDALGQEWTMESPDHDIILTFMCLTGEVNRKERDRAKETLSRLDRLIYETYTGQETKMADIRNSMAPLLNKTIKAWFSIEWPQPGASLDYNKHKPDSEAGNKIKIAKSFVLCNPSGQTLIPARVETMN